MAANNAREEKIETNTNGKMKIIYLLWRNLTFAEFNFF